MNLSKGQIVTGKISKWIGILLQIDKFGSTAKVLLLLSSKGLLPEKDGTTITIEVDKIRPTTLTKSQKAKLFNQVPKLTRIEIMPWEYVLRELNSSIRIELDSVFGETTNDIELRYHPSNLKNPLTNAKSRKLKILQSCYCIGGWWDACVDIKETGRIIRYKTDMLDFSYLK
jgi:hypothetical protein